MEQITITAKIQISATSEDKELLNRTMSIYTDACNYVSDYVFRTHDLSSFLLTRLYILSCVNSLVLNLKWLSLYLRLLLQDIKPSFKKPQYDL